MRIKYVNTYERIREPSLSAFHRARNVQVNGGESLISRYVQSHGLIMKGSVCHTCAIVDCNLPFFLD